MGDTVVLINNVPITRDNPIKSVIIDLPDGAATTFHLIRGAPPPAGEAPRPAGGKAPMPVAPGGDLAFAVPLPTPAADSLQPPERSSAAESEEDMLAKRLEALQRK